MVLRQPKGAVDEFVLGPVQANWCLWVWVEIRTTRIPRTRKPSINVRTPGWTEAQEGLHGGLHCCAHEVAVIGEGRDVAWTAEDILGAMGP